MTGKLHKLSKSDTLSEENRVKQFEDIYTKYFDKLYGYARLICNSQSLAKDVVSEFFYNLWKNQTDLKAIQNLEAYLLVSIKNQAVQALSLSRKELSKEDFEVTLNTIDYIDPEEVFMEKELRVALDTIVSSLPDHSQLIFKMAKEQGLKYAEIAHELGISVKTVKSQLKIAQSKIRSAISKFELDRKGGAGPDIRLIGQFLFLFGCISCYSGQ